VLVVVGGLVLELAPDATVPHPFVLEPIAVGEEIDGSRVRWVDVPRGLLTPVNLPVTATRHLEPGEPVLGAVNDAALGGGIPTGWWAIELDIPGGARPGMVVRLVSHLGSAEGLIVDVREGDFGERTGLVAVPADQATAVAEAALGGVVAVMLGG
jgi:hypothetical protein